MPAKKRSADGRQIVIPVTLPKELKLSRTDARKLAQLFECALLTTINVRLERDVKMVFNKE